MSTRRTNRIQLEGNLGKDADHKKTDKSEVVKFSLAVNERWMDKSKVEHKRTDWFFIEVWGSAASSAAALKRGRRCQSKARSAQANTPERTA